MKLKIAKIRGIESHGMLCSGFELNESSDKEGFTLTNSYISGSDQNDAKK